MSDQMSGEPNYHVLLVGIDAYATRPLAGCVRDVDAVQHVLLGPRMGLDPARIRRLTSPRPGVEHDDRVVAQPATSANLRRELGELAERATPGDRVFIYYAGHGTRLTVPGASGRSFHREALVPADCDPSGDLRLLYDFELNALLRSIVQRTRSVALVLDCCHAAGATRSVLDAGHSQSRFIELSERGVRSAPLDQQTTGAGESGEPERLARSIEDCHVVAACLGHERAQEERGADGLARGLFTWALTTALDATDADLRTVTWGRIWQAVHARVQLRNPGQQPLMIGHPGRAVFGGPPTHGDAGFTVIRVGDAYRIAAGTLARVTPGAALAVYDEQPPSFPRLDSAEDLAVRLGVVEVISAERATATATAIGAPFPLPPAARGRLIRAGANARLRCAVIPSDPSLEARLASSPLLELVADPVKPEVRLEHREGRWYVTDPVHGTGSDGPVLFALQPAELDCARDVLDHYHAYSRPLHMAALAIDLAGNLELRVWSCAGAPTASADAQTVALPEAPTRAESCYALRSGDPVCFEVRNGSPRRLRVTLLNSAGSGRVQQLGDEVIDAGHSHVFWANGAIGVPFQMVPPRGSTRCIDRLVAIGRTATAHDLGYLRVDRTFAQVIQRSRSGGRVLDDGTWNDPHGPEQWTAAQVLIETAAR